MVLFPLRLSDLRNINMAEQPAQDHAECFAATVQTPHTVDFNLPPANPDDVSCIILKWFLEATTQ